MIRLQQRNLLIRSNSVLRVQRCLVAWSLKNVRETNNEIVKTSDSSKITIEKGYYNFTSLQETLKKSDITIERLPDNRVSLTSSNAINFKNFGVLLEFEKDKVIASNTKTISGGSAGLTNGLKSIAVYSSLIASDRVYHHVGYSCVNSSKFFELSIDTTQSMNGDFTEYNLDNVILPCNNFTSQEFEMDVESGGDIDDYEIYLTISIV